MNKIIHRDTKTTTKVFDHRTLRRDYATLIPVLKKGLRVLDVGCGTGAISKDIAEAVGEQGCVTGIDNTEAFIIQGREAHRSVRNLELVHADLFNFHPDEKFDLVVAARVVQWLNNPDVAIKVLATFLKPGGQLSILDYNHEDIVWKPEPPESMRRFYKAFLNWRADNGMDNRIGDHLAAHFREAGFHSIEVLEADEVYRKGEVDFAQRAGIWSKVAELKQIVDEGYLNEVERLRTISEYDQWVELDAQCMTLNLTEVRGKI
ncbi:MAG: methyltransferase domain-containing protein [Chryseosolibacter sp.]